MEVRLAVSPNIDLCTPVLLSTTNSVLAGKDREVIAVLTNTAASACAYFQNFGGVFVVGLEYERNQRGCVPKRIVAYFFHRVGYVKLGYPRAGKKRNCRL